MKRRLPISLLFIFVYVFSSTAKEWCSIVPLHSTRADVERLLKAKPVRCGGGACLYELSDKTVFVLYAAEPTCRNDDAKTSWKVPRDTVIEISLYFKTPQSFSTLDIDVTKYDRVPDKELHGIVYLSDYAQGIRMETSGDTVREITYYPAATEDHLRCPPSSKSRVKRINLPQDSGPTSPPARTPFEERLNGCTQRLFGVEHTIA